MIVVPRGASPAVRWLAHLLRATEGSSRRGDLFDDDFPFEDGAVLRLALRHGVAPLLHRGLAEGCIGDPLTTPFRTACERVYREVARRNAVALETGRQLLSVLVEAGVDAAPIGGWALLAGKEPAHPDAGTRPLESLDLLVRDRDRAHAEAALDDLGFNLARRRSTSQSGPFGAHFVRESEGQGVVVALRRAGAVGASSLAISGDQILDHYCREEITGSLETSQVANLLIAADHAAAHVYDRWIWLVDLHRLVGLSPMDWQRTVYHARAWRLCGALYAGLVASRELLRTPVPKEALHALAPGILRRRLLRRSLAGSMAERPAPGAVRAARVLVSEGWLEVARTVARVRRTAPAPTVERPTLPL